jgi:cell division protein FtsQ
VQLSAAVLLRRRAAALVGVALACGLATGAVSLGYVWLRSSSVFVLQSVAVRGGTESDRLAVRDAVARAAAGDSLLALSSSKIARAVETVPTVHIARVDRDFPHTLRIRITPERPVAVAIAKGRYRSLVASSGRVIRTFAPDEKVPTLPRIWPRERPVAGEMMHTAPVQAVLDALSARPAGFRAKIANVQVEPERGIVLNLQGGLDIVLGPPLQLESKLKAAGWVLRRYPTRNERAQLRYADVSAPNRPAVMPVGGYTETAGLGRQTTKKKDEKSQKNSDAGAGSAEKDA